MLYKCHIIFKVRDVSDQITRFDIVSTGPNTASVRSPMFESAAENLHLEDLLKMCKPSILHVNDGKYMGMHLVMPGETKGIHTRIIVSAMHKLMRQKLSGELVYMLGCFYMAVSKDPGNPQAGPMKANMTSVSNRFAICIFEEGCMLLLDEPGQRTVVSLLLKILVAPRSIFNDLIHSEMLIFFTCLQLPG